jgi:hypothetical protein
MDLKELYDYSYDFLITKDSKYLKKELIDDFISTADIKDCNSLTDAYELLLNILQDFNRYPYVIKYIDRKDKIKEILHNYDFSYIARLEPSQLLEIFRDAFKFDRDTLWLRYTKGVISGAKYMLNFDNYDDFKNTFDSFNTNDMTREYFAMFLSTKIDNMGFAIACNWLKELGYYEYAKPDTHTKDICDALHLASKKNDVKCFEAMVKVAREAGVKTYKVDKVWWLICTGNFYRYNIKCPEYKNEFILSLKYKFNT